MKFGWVSRKLWNKTETETQTPACWIRVESVTHLEKIAYFHVTFTGDFERFQYLNFEASFLINNIFIYNWSAVF